MFNAEKISDKLMGLVGFRQPYNPEYAILDSSNQLSRSGLFVTDNEFCKIEYLKDSQDYADISDADFNSYLTRKNKESIVNVCNQVFNESSFRERDLIYKRARNKTTLETLPIGFVGFRIIPNFSNNIAIQIKRVICEFSGTGTFELLLFNTGSKTPLFTKSITITSDNQSIDLDWTLDNTNTYAGEYYIGYIANNLSVTPYKRDWNAGYTMTSFCDFDLLKVKFVNHLTNTMPDLTHIEGMFEDIGLNLDINTFDDYTDLICNNEMLFSRAINYDLQISCLSTYLASLRSNANERNADRTALRVLAEIEGQSSDNAIKITGLRPQLYRALSSIKKEIKSLQTGYLGDVLQTDTLC